MCESLWYGLLYNKTILPTWNIAAVMGKGGHINAGEKDACHIGNTRNPMTPKMASDSTHDNRMRR